MTENRESPLSVEVPILEGQVLTGPLFSEPMRVEPLSIETKFTRSSSAVAVDVRWTNKEDAPAVRMTEENRIQRQFPLTHRDVVSRCRSKYGNFKQNQRFNGIMKFVENPEQHGERCRRHGCPSLPPRDRSARSTPPRAATRRMVQRGPSKPIPFVRIGSGVQ